jgi:hypothetical protein
MKLDLTPRGEAVIMSGTAQPLPVANLRNSLRETKSSEAIPYRTSYESAGRLSPERTPTMPKKQSFLPEPVQVPSASSSRRQSLAPQPSPFARKQSFTPEASPSARSQSFAPEPETYGGEDEVQMTFDTEFRDPPKPPAKDYPPGTSNGSWSSRNAKKESGKEVTVDAPVRPVPHTTKTAPAISIADPWADPDDEDFGKESEMTMTFA